MDEEITQFVVESLGRGVPEQDVILAVCERTGVTWQEAKSIVFSASVYRSKEIARWQIPILFLVGTATILAGIAVIAAFIQGIIQPVSQISQYGLSFEMVESIGLYAWMIANMQFAGEVVFGAAMIAGGITGLYVAAKNAL
jgi:hypothetical protein